MNSSSSPDITQILQDWNAGDASAPQRLMPLVYNELRSLGAHYLRRERSDHTLQATALVHEAYLKMVNQKWAAWQDRVQFARVAARAMRQVLVEYARAYRAEKRGGKLEKLYLDETRELGSGHDPDLIELDEALKNFAELYPRESEVVEMKFFGGLDAEDIAKVLNVSTKTINRDWNFAKTWLCRELTENAA
ncbi:MAG TPA: sigma-70 family RNA polymerase sigma factor [Chthoniobacterales bacterium]|nr:sigma-70 family RNA polymerase sigma factor [Chthoniobacterales bacterium]